MGTHVLLECVRMYGKVRRFIHVSTDEVCAVILEHSPPCTMPVTPLRCFVLFWCL